jgi:hypothetical protein
MSEQDPAIIQGDHPFKVEAVLSKTGGVNALAKRPKKMHKGPEILSQHHESVSSEGLHTAERVHLDADLADKEASEGPLLQEQFDTQHREQFTDPSRRLTTNQRVKIQTSDNVQGALLQEPPEDKSHLSSPVVSPSPAPSTHDIGHESHEGEAAAPLAEPIASAASAVSAASEPEPRTTSTAETEAQEHRQQFLRRIEQIKNTNESVGKDLEALEKLTSLRPGPKASD